MLRGFLNDSSDRGGTEPLPAALRVLRRCCAKASALTVLSACGLIIGCGGDKEPTASNSVRPVITAQPQSTTIAVSQTATFTVQASGSSPLQFQWSRTGASIAGATGASYTTSPASVSDNGASFTVVVSNSAGSVASSAATLTVNAPPTIATEPADAAVPNSQMATFSVIANGTAALSYQWRRNGAAIGGAVSGSHTTASVSPSDDGARFDVIVTNDYGQATSRAARLTVLLGPTITAHPASRTVQAGQPANFSVTAQGTGTPSYQWYRNGEPIVNATASTYSIASTARSDSATSYTVRVTDMGGSVTSNAATLTVIGGFSNGVGGLHAEFPGNTPGLVGLRYRMRVVENRGGFIIVFGSNRYYTPGSLLTYLTEGTLFSQRREGFTSNTCSGYPPAGTLLPLHASLWLGVPDYNFESGATAGLTGGILNDDEQGWPIQQSSIDNIPNLYRTDAMSQAELEGRDVLVTIQRGDTTSNTAAFNRCGRNLLSQVYRQWTMRVDIEGRVVTQRVVLPDQGGRFIVPNESFMFYSEFLAAPGPFTVQYWDLEAQLNGDQAWTHVPAFRTFPNYDGTGFDFGVRVVQVDGAQRFEFSNRPNVYLLGDRLVPGM